LPDGDDGAQPRGGARRHLLVKKTAAKSSEIFSIFAFIAFLGIAPGR
jgi:hypothetical protein